MPLQLMAAVLQNELTTLSSGNTITDLDPDFRIRLPSPAVAEVGCFDSFKIKIAASTTQEHTIACIYTCIQTLSLFQVVFKKIAIKHFPFFVCMLLQVMLSNNCAMDTCVTDFSLSQEGVAYLPR